MRKFKKAFENQVNLFQREILDVDRVEEIIDALIRAAPVTTTTTLETTTTTVQTTKTLPTTTTGSQNAAVVTTTTQVLVLIFTFTNHYLKN